MRSVFGFSWFGSGGGRVAIYGLESLGGFDVLRSEGVKDSEEFNVKGAVRVEVMMFYSEVRQVSSRQERLFPPEG